jgi:hypothetical protein
MGVRPRRKSRWVFWILLIAVIVGIAATGLLANNKRNLRELIQRYRITWIVLDPIELPKRIVVAKRGNRLLPSAAVFPNHLPLHALEDFHVPPVALVRRWQVSGEQLCAALTKAGLDVEAWHQGDLYSSTYECSSQTQPSEQASEPASLFLLVRGTQTGEVSSVRIKIIIPENDEGKIVEQKFHAATEILFRESKWAEFDTALDQIAKLQNVKQSTFGARLVFSHEFTDPRRFNLILDLNAATPQQRLTETYFDRSKWLTLLSSAEN